jgi:hypothetical protein
MVRRYVNQVTWSNDECRGKHLKKIKIYISVKEAQRSI